MTNTKPWRADVYPTRYSNNRWMRKIDTYTEKTTKYGTVSWTVSATDDEKKKFGKILARSHMKVSWYKKEWGRSSTYRNTFFRDNEEPYRCRYCNRRIRKEYVTVDHIFPVGRVKKSVRVREWMHFFGIHDVNERRNLCACCFKCNQKKQDKTGIWVVRGFLGKHQWYWFCRRVVRMLFVCILAAGIYYMTRPSVFQEVMETILRFVTGIG